MKNISFTLSLICLMFCFNFSAQKTLGAYSQDILFLEKGDVITRLLPAEKKGGPRVTQAMILIDAPAEKAWNVIEDQQKLKKMIDKLEDIQVIEKTNNYQKIKASVKLASFLPPLKYTIYFDQSQKFKKMKFHKIDGSIKTLNGSIEFKPYKNGTIVTYNMLVETGIYIPPFIREMGMKKDLPKIMKAIKHEAES